MTTGGNTGKGKLVTDGNGKPQTGVGKKGLLRKTASHRLPLTEGNGKKREADVSRKATDDGGQKNNGKFTNGKSGKKNLRKKFYGKQSQRPPLVGGREDDIIEHA